MYALKATLVKIVFYDIKSRQATFSMLNFITGQI